MLTRITIVEEKKTIQNEWLFMTFDDIFLLKRYKIQCFLKKKHQLVFKGFLYCDVSLVDACNFVLKIRVAWKEDNWDLIENLSTNVVVSGKKWCFFQYL